MSESPKLSISSDVKRLLTSEGERWLTEDEIVQLQVHMNMICGWANRVPETTKFFFVQWAPVLVLPRIEGFTREQLSIAACLQPLHSQLCAIAVQVLWKSDQLIRALCSALNAGDLIVAATMARSLMETTASFGCETDAITVLWRERKRRPAPDMHSLGEFNEAVFDVIGQILFGTRLTKDEQPETGIQRTNILTFIKKAEKISEYSGLLRLYEVLCDTVHPSIGANRCFWTEEPTSSDSDVLEFTGNRLARGLLGNLPYAIGKGAIWSLQWLGHMWVLFERTRNDLCLTGNIYALHRPYYGVITPGDPSGFCPCGSGVGESSCNHQFGVQ
ncbi:MAG: hypothetical protein ACRD22_00135 [Terriglobia bacterium]